MSITDELREWSRDNLTQSAGLCITAIADRIDAEHERLMQEQPYTIDMVPMTDEHMAEHGWIRLPKDADGEYIHIGDVMAYADNTKPMVVVALVPPAVFLTEDGPRYADMCRHYHAPTAEDALREFAERWHNAKRGERTFDYDALVAEYAKRLTLADKEDA